MVERNRGSFLFGSGIRHENIVTQQRRTVVPTVVILKLTAETAVLRLEKSLGSTFVPEPIEWGFFDRRNETFDSHRKLPHKEQSGTVTFVTMRLADSMPHAVVQQWHDEIESWLKENGLAGSNVEDVLNSTSVSPRLKTELRKFKNRQWHQRLDNCHGECTLNRHDCRAEVCKSILHFNSERYDLESFVVMPNHVHVLIQMREEYFLRKQFREIQRFSARAINKMLARTGRFWQGEPFDHMVRNAEQLENFHQYIAENPSRAGLSTDQCTYWSCRDT